MVTGPTVLEVCAGAGGMALGLERAGFRAAGLVEVDRHACATLRANRPGWPVMEEDVRGFDPATAGRVDLLAGGVPCPPFSVAGRQLGAADERDLFPVAVRLAGVIRPKSVFLENVPGFALSRFKSYRRRLASRLESMGYRVRWRILNACDHGVPQLRPRFVLVAMQERWSPYFAWPEPFGLVPQTVGETLKDLMGENGWPGAAEWAEKASSIAPTLVGGSKNHGGADLGPTRAKKAWKKLGVNGLSLADAAPDPDFPRTSLPRLTIRMAARIQGFPDSWSFCGGKTAAYRQIGNALPPSVAAAVGRSIASAVQEEEPSRGDPQIEVRYQPA